MTSSYGPSVNRPTAAQTLALIVGVVFLLFGGRIIYLLLMAYGFIVDHESSANFVPLNSTDNVLHLVLGVGVIGLGVVTSRHVEASMPPSRGSATSA